MSNILGNCTLSSVSITCSGSVTLTFSLPITVSPQTVAEVNFVPTHLPAEFHNATIEFDDETGFIVVSNVDPLYQSTDFCYSITLCGVRKHQIVSQKVLVVPPDCSGGAGSQGQQGKKGMQGRKGMQGAKGTDGSQGSLGDQGTRGLQGARDFIMDLIIVDNILVGVRNNEAAAPLVDTLISARINSDGTLSAFNTFYLPLTRSFSFYWAGLKRHPTAPVVYVCGTSIQKNATIIQAVAISTSGVASIPASPLSSSITIPGMQFLPSRPNYINQKMYFFNGVIQIYQNHAQNGTTLSDNFLVTILVNDNNPFLMSLIARTPANFGGPHTQFLATPNGCLITMDDSTSAVFLLGAKKCAKQLIAEEKLSTPLCTAVQCAENPNRVNQFSVGPSSYCPPCNPYVVHADMDALSTGSTCRELSRPAGLHIPFATATVNASMALFQKSGATNDFAGLAGAGQFRLFNGCPNKYGCEFWVTGNNNTRRFVLSQDSFLLNAGTGAIAPATPIESNATLNTVDFVDMHCYRDIMYGLSNNVTVGAFYTNILGGVIGFNLNTVSGIATSSPFTVFAIYDHYVYAAINTRVVAFELYTGTLINLSSIISNATIMDLIIVDKTVVIIWTDSVTSTDMMASIIINADGSLGTQSSTVSLGTKTQSRNFAGLTKHPVLPIVYVGCLVPVSTLFFIAIASVLINQSNTPTPLFSAISNFADVSSVFSGIRMKPSYCDGVLQLLIPTTTGTSMITFSVSDNDPAFFTVRTIGVANGGSVSPQFLSTKTGQYIFASSTGDVVIFGASLASQQYLTDAPVNRAISIRSFINNTTFVISGSNLRLNQNDSGTFIFLNQKNALTSGSNNIFTNSITTYPSMIVRLDVVFWFLITAGPNVNYQITAQTLLPSPLAQLFDATYVQAINQFYTLHLHGIMEVRQGDSITLRMNTVANLSPQPSSSISIEFLDFQ